MKASSGPGGGTRASGRAPSCARVDRRPVLVVEDDVDFRELLVEHLAAAGWVVRSAGNGAEALAVLTGGDDEIGMVLLDLRMPVMDGFELCGRLDAQAPAVPIVVMTAEHETRQIERCGRVIDVLFKPLDLARLDALIDAHALV